jgi:hypothetical protein
MLKRFLCWLLGHRDDVLKTSGPRPLQAGGAAFKISVYCSRCGARTYSWLREYPSYEEAIEMHEVYTKGRIPFDG